MSRIVALTNQKGGVGKTSLCWNLAVYLSARFGKRVLVIDLDTQGNISHTLIKYSDASEIPHDALNFYGCQTKMLFDVNMSPDVLQPMRAFYGCDLIYTEPNDLSLTQFVYQKLQDDPAGDHNAPLNHFILTVREFAKNYDYVLIDCPPFIGQHILAALMVCDYVINPIQPTSFVLDGTSGFFQNLQQIGREEIFLGLVLNNVDKRWVRHEAMEQVLKEQLGDKVYRTTIHHRAPFDAAIYLNKPLWRVPAWNTAHEETEAFVRETVSRMNEREGIADELTVQDEEMEK